MCWPFSFCNQLCNLFLTFLKILKKDLLGKLLDLYMVSTFFQLSCNVLLCFVLVNFLLYFLILAMFLTVHILLMSRNRKLLYNTTSGSWKEDLHSPHFRGEVYFFQPVHLLLWVKALKLSCKTEIKFKKSKSVYLKPKCSTWKVVQANERKVLLLKLKRNV